MRRQTSGGGSWGRVVFRPLKDVPYLFDAFVLAIKRLAKTSETEGNSFAREAFLFCQMMSNAELKSPMFRTPTTTTCSSISLSLTGVSVGT